MERSATIASVTVTVTIETIDRQRALLTGRTATGARLTLQVKDPKLLAQLSPGDRVQITYRPATPGSTPVATATAPVGAQPAQPAAGGLDAGEQYPTWGVLDTSGSGIVLGSGSWGSVSLGGYLLVRYVNQLPAQQTFTDHLGNVNVIDTRNDIQFHRAMLHFKGWLGSPKLRWQITVWSLLSTVQTTLYGFVGYQWRKWLNFYGGIDALPGSRSLFGSHPFWLANDRVMADEFFRPSFSGGTWVNGEIAPGLWYKAMVANNLSQLGVSAKQLTRALGTGVGVWWMPTTKEFGPNGSFDDWEYHEKLATRFGFGTARADENRLNQNNDETPDNTTIRMVDSVPLFQTGALAKGVTISDAFYRILSFDAGMKYKGIFLQTEIYNRWLDNFRGDGPVPVASVHDKGFYIQGAFYPIKKKLELYGAMSQIYGDKHAGYGNSHEFLQGLNFFPFNARNYRVNGQVIEVDHSAASSLFGFYVGGQTGTTVSVAASVWF